MSAPLGRLARTLGPPLLSTSLAVLAFCGVGELVARRSIPFTQRSWPARNEAASGTTFQPGAEVRWTNDVDFWTSTRANAIGFLDREPPGPKGADSCRVLFIGDSFVEAAQVPIADKVHVVFERLHRERFPTPRVETMALGYSGTGQVNQLQFYDAFGRDFGPDVVVLVVVQNDFANNSPTLEAVRNGWHPEHAPRFFFRRDAAGGAFVPMPVDVHYASMQLPAPPSAPEGWARGVHRRLDASSVFYHWVFAHAAIQYPGVVAFLVPPPIGETYAFRRREIERLPGYEQVFTGWRYPDDLDFDRIFFADALPPVFVEAEAFTAHALDEFRARGLRDGFHLVALSSHGLSLRFADGATENGRRLVDAGYRRRFQALLAERGIPLVDQLAWILARGGRVEDARFRHDAHWSPQAHRWAAEALLDHFTRTRGLCE